MHKKFFTPIDVVLSRVHNPLTSRMCSRETVEAALKIPGSRN
jgi:hypothetical protein